MIALFIQVRERLCQFSFVFLSQPTHPSLSPYTHTHTPRTCRYECVHSTRTYVCMRASSLLFLNWLCVLTLCIFDVYGVWGEGRGEGGAGPSDTSGGKRSQQLHQGARLSLSHTHTHTQIHGATQKHAHKHALSTHIVPKTTHTSTRLQGHAPRAHSSALPSHTHASKRRTHMLSSHVMPARSSPLKRPDT